jgi:outer membrane protein assembly factor BamE (lipoprotein component of BamABCDE complex)
MKYLLCLALSLVLVGCGGGSSLTLTQDNLNKIHNDMSQSEVKAILGDPTSSETKPIPIVGGDEVTYTYQNTQNGTQAVIVFKNDKVQSKTGQFNP